MTTDDMTTDTGTDLLALVARGDRAGLAAALESGADPNAADRWGVTALARAAAKGDLAMADLLLAKGAEVDRASAAGNTALMAAAAAGRVEMLERLLSAGADHGHGNTWGVTAYDWAQWPPNGADVQALLEEGRAD